MRPGWAGLPPTDAEKGAVTVEDGVKASSGAEAMATASMRKALARL